MSEHLEHERPVEKEYGPPLGVTRRRVYAVALIVVVLGFLSLPLMLYETMGAYRMDRAAVIALALAVMALGLFVVMERLVGGRRHG